MSINAKRKGTRNEHRTINALEAIGYRCTRAAGSLGEWDVIAIGRNDIRMIQVKTNCWPGSAETETLRAFPAPSCATREIWRWDDRRPNPQIRILKPRKRHNSTLSA